MANLISRTVKLAISLLFFIGRCVRNAILRSVGRQPAPNVTILYYHSIPADQRSNFARQMDTLLRWTEPIEAGFRSLPSTGPRFGAVTFDDGFVSFLDNALPELKKRRIPVTLFMIAGRLGCHPDWPEFTMPAEKYREPLMTEEQLRVIARTVTIGSHTLTHPT